MKTSYIFGFGKSMVPTLGRISLIKITRQPEYKQGDIVSLKTHDKIFHCHRILEIDDNYVSTKGDNLPQQSYEIKVPIKNIEGTVKEVWRIMK
jgi:hypothetical protein